MTDKLTEGPPTAEYWKQGYEQYREAYKKQIEFNDLFQPAAAMMATIILYAAEHETIQSQFDDLITTLRLVDSEYEKVASSLGHFTSAETLRKLLAHQREQLVKDTQRTDE